MGETMNREHSFLDCSLPRFLSPMLREGHTLAEVGINRSPPRRIGKVRVAKAQSKVGAEQDFRLSVESPLRTRRMMA